MAKILVTGANGQLGNEMRCLAEEDKKNTFLFTDIQDLDITDLEAVMKYVAGHGIEVDSQFVQIILRSIKQRIMRILVERLMLWL